MPKELEQTGYQNLKLTKKKLLEEMNIAFVVKDLTIDYTYPLKIFDEFVVTSKLKKLSNTYIIIKQDIFKKNNSSVEKNQICRKLEVGIIMMNLSSKNQCWNNNDESQQPKTNQDTSRHPSKISIC